MASVPLIAWIFGERLARERHGGRRDEVRRELNLRALLGGLGRPGGRRRARLRGLRLGRWPPAAVTSP